MPGGGPQVQNEIGDGDSDGLAVAALAYDLIADYLVLAWLRLATTPGPAAAVRLGFAVDNQLAAALDFVGKDLFLVLNSDNYYPVAALRAMRELESAGIALFA